MEGRPARVELAIIRPVRPFANTIDGTRGSVARARFDVVVAGNTAAVSLLGHNEHACVHPAATFPITGCRPRAPCTNAHLVGDTVDAVIAPRAVVAHGARFVGGPARGTPEDALVKVVGLRALGRELTLSVDIDELIAAVKRFNAAVVSGPRIHTRA